MNDLINLEDLKDLHQDEMNARIAEANETYNKRVTEVEKGAQKAAERANLGDKALQALVEIGGDDQKFVDLYNEDPKTAKYILEKMYP